MPIDDEQLDQLLRDVSVPHDLKASLLAIPDQDTEPTVAAARSNSRFAIVGLLAAIAATVLVFICLPIVPEPKPVANVEVGNQSVEMLLAEMQQNLDAIDQIRHIQDLEFARVESLKNQPGIGLEESLALAMSLSWQSSLDRGASIESVRSELEYVINTFPETRGAQQAYRMLQLN